MSTTIAILGAGAMGTAVAHALAVNGHAVRLWDYNPETIANITKTRQHAGLPDVQLSDRITPMPALTDAIIGARLVILAASSPFIRSTTERLVRALKNAQGPVIAHVAKGLEEKTNATMHEVIQSVLPRQLRAQVVTLSGPSLAIELARGIPTGMIAASTQKNARTLVQRVFVGSPIQITPSTDVRGVSLCGSLKNVYAIALGMCDGMRLSFNAKALLFTTAVNEMMHIIEVLGGKRETILGLAGIGDLVVTGLGDGRNRSLGERICREGHCRFIAAETTQTWEGIAATHTFTVLLKKKNQSTPLLTLVSRVLQVQTDPCAALTQFFKIKKR